MEKADILELTVTHVQKLHQQQQWTDVAVNEDVQASSKFKAGFSECARLVRELLQAQCRKVEPALEQRLVEHLDHCLTTLDQVNQHKSPNSHQLHHSMSSSSRSPSPVSSFSSHQMRSDSRSSFEGKDTVLLSPQSPPSVHPPFGHSKSPLPAPPSAAALPASGLNGVAAATSNGLVGGAGGAGSALSRTGQRQLWGASSGALAEAATTTTTAAAATKSAFVSQPHADWRGPLTAADLNSQCLTSCSVNANSGNGGDLLLGRGKGSRIVSPECAATGVAVHSPNSTHSATAVDGSPRCQLPVARITSPVARGKTSSSASSPSASDEDDSGSSSGSISQPSSPVSALDLRAQVGRVHLDSSSWPQQVALLHPHETLWTHSGSGLTAVAGHLSLIRQQQQQHQQLTCSKMSLDDSRVWRPW